MLKKLSFLPSSKFIFSLLFLIIIVAGISFGARYKQKKQARDILTAAEIRINNANVLVDDTDNDGLLDWEEALWGLNPIDADTDGDGITDKEEVDAYKSRLGNTPVSLDAGQTTGSLSLEDLQNLTQSDVLARQVYATLAIAESNGEVPDQAKADISQAIQQQVQQPLITESLGIDSLIVVPTNEANFVAYTQKITPLLAELPLNATTIASFITTLEKQGDMSVYRPIADEYRKMHETAKALPTPQNAVAVHLSFVNVTENLARAFEILTNPDADPILTFQAFLQLETLLENFDASIRDFGTYFQRSAESYKTSQQSAGAVVQ
jgi:hypothetical protein